MADNLDRIFVEVRFDEKTADLSTALASLEARLTIGALGNGVDPAALDAKPALASIMFAIWVSMVHISVDCNKDIWLSERAEFHLAYDLLYRRVNEDALVATYQKIMDLATGETIIR